MDNISHIPHDSDNILRLVQHAIEGQEFDKAFTLLNDSLAQNSTMDVAITLILLNIDLMRFDEAKKVWQTHIDHSHISNFPTFYKEWIEHMPSIFSPSQIVTELSQLIPHLSHSSELLSISQELLTENLSKLTNMDKIKNHNFDDLIETYEGKSSMEILTFLKDVYAESHPNTTAFLKYWLHQADLGNYITADILHYLIRSKDSDPITIEWFGKQHTIKLDQLVPYHQSPAYQANLDAIKSYFNEHDPHLLNDAIQQYQFHALTFYPFIDEILQGEDDWLNAFKHDYLMQEEVPVTPSLIKYLPLANQELFKLMS